MRRFRKVKEMWVCRHMGNRLSSKMYHKAAPLFLVFLLMPLYGGIGSFQISDDIRDEGELLRDI